jgi:hypothetical protein
LAGNVWGVGASGNRETLQAEAKSWNGHVNEKKGKNQLDF